MWWSIWAARTGCWSSTRLAISRRGHPVPACKGKLRHGGQGGELPGRGVPQLRLGAGHALIDRELYLPASWVANPGRCAATGIPEGTVFATKPELALRMITRALDAGTPADWVTGDAVYGADSGLRAGLEDLQVSSVLAVAKNHPVTTAAAPGARTCWPESYRYGPGSGCRRGPAPRATAGMTGPGSASIRVCPGTAGC